MKTNWKAELLMWFLLVIFCFSMLGIYFCTKNECTFVIGQNNIPLIDIETDNSST